MKEKIKSLILKLISLRYLFLKICLTLSFLYLWEDWIKSFLFFSEEDQLNLRYFIEISSISFVLSMGILLSFFKKPKFIMYPAILLLIITSTLYASMLGAKAWGVGIIGLLTNFGAMFLIYNNHIRKGVKKCQHQS